MFNTAVAACLGLYLVCANLLTQDRICGARALTSIVQNLHLPQEDHYDSIKIFVLAAGRRKTLAAFQ